MDKSLKDYVSSKKGLLIAPAGYGKTTFLSDCVEAIIPYISKPILILTHTHAGVASIKKKIAKNGINSNFIKISTISGICQLLFTYYHGEQLPTDKNNRPDFKNINDKVKPILRLRFIQRIIGNSYSHIFVDEYQDCDWAQHIIINRFATFVPLHIMADPLQSIFRFNAQDRYLDFNKDFKDFKIFSFMDVPWRWYQEGNNMALGSCLKSIRCRLLNGESITFSEIEGANFIRKDSDDNNFWKDLRSLIKDINSTSLLLLFPNDFKYGIESRAQKRTQFDLKREFTLIEAIDDKSFYACANYIDKMLSSSGKLLFQRMRAILSSLSLNKGDVD